MLKGSEGDGLLQGRLWGLEYVGKTITYSQMLSGHHGSYAFTPQGMPKHTAGEYIRAPPTRGNRLEAICSHVSRVCWRENSCYQAPSELLSDGQMEETFCEHLTLDSSTEVRTSSRLFSQAYFCTQPSAQSHSGDLVCMEINSVPSGFGSVSQTETPTPLTTTTDGLYWCVVTYQCSVVSCVAQSPSIELSW